MAIELDGDLDRRFPPWFVFGVRDNGRVDVSDRNGDVLTDIGPEEAVRVIKERDAMTSKLLLVLKTLKECHAYFDDQGSDYGDEMALRIAGVLDEALR